MSIRRAICALFRPKRNVRRKQKWMRLYVAHYDHRPSWARDNIERK